MKKKIYLLMVMCIISAFVLFGCQSTDVKEEIKPEDNTVNQEAGTSSDNEYGEVVIKNGERTVTFTKMPQKVLCTNLYSAENMVMLGLEQYIVGKNVAANPAEVPLPEIADKFTNIKEIERSHENAVATGADLIIGQISTYKEDTWGSFDMFESKGINCYVISGTIAEDETIENVYYDIEVLGKIFKVEDKAEQLINDMKTRIENVKKVSDTIPEDKKLTVFVLDSFKGNEIYTTSKGLQSNLIELAGAKNATRNMADSRWFNTSVETLVATNPDVIIFNDYGAQTIQEKMDFVDNNPALKDVPAVKNKNYITIPLVSVMQDVRAATACETFAEKFYPEYFK